MFRDDEIDDAARQLAKYRESAELTSILDKYSALIDDYRRLKSDYEEERDAREKYKQMARGRDQNPFALVLVDGDGYVFHEKYVAEGSDGGNSAARALTTAVANSLRSKGLDGCQVLVRIYANVMGLSKALARAGLCGNEARSLAPFIASFNRSYGLCELVDAGNLKENADFKIRALLRFYTDSPQCKHIYFAACHDVGYISELMPYGGSNNKVTLVRTSGVKFHPEFHKLDMPIEELPGVFRTTPLPESTTGNTTSSNSGAGTGANGTANGSASESWRKTAASPQVCQFYKMGKCRFGKTCNKLHIDAGEASSELGGMNNNSNNNNNGSSSSSLLSRWERSSEPAESVSVIPVKENGLPLEKSDIPEGKVAINRDGFRLDYYIAQPSADATARLRQRSTKKGGLCNKFYLLGDCDAGSKCDFDHSPLPPELLGPLDWLAHSLPCRQLGNCFDARCIKGHICQIEDCRHRRGKSACRLPGIVHNTDLVVRGFRPAVSNATSVCETHDENSDSGDGAHI